MDNSSDWFLCMAVALIAWLYSSVGHAGASGYIAVMTLAGFAPERIKPLALVLNILVASITSVQFYRAGHFSWKLFWPIALLASPMAYLGGYLSLPLDWFKALLGLVLAGSAFWLLFPIQAHEKTAEPTKPVAIVAGAGLGLLSGLTGTGGGIYLSPLLLWMGWAKTKTVSAVSAVFILVNSVSGLAGLASSGRAMPEQWYYLALWVVIGGSIGATLGSFKLPVRWARILLSIVMGIASAKLLTAS
jgi:uncharacterized membrane protein YfcA